MPRAEVVRASYRPRKVRLLFVGESPPASGRFFYHRDSGLYRAMRDAFIAVDRTIDDENFLKRFQDAGCYLVDLCGRPVDDLDPAPRRAACAAAVPRLARTIAELNPDCIATLVRSIEANVKSAASRASWDGPLLHLPYPGRWIRHQRIFAEQLAPEIRKLLRQPSVPPTCTQADHSLSALRNRVASD